MCYYATTDYLCGDWKWGNMMLRCPRQHRIGETCGAKLVHHESVTKSATICKVCEEINTKQRRLSRNQDNISRWSREPDKFSASLEKARREAKELEEKIRELHLRRPSIATNILGGGTKSSSGGRSAATAAATATTLPPVTSMSTSSTPGYEYTTAPGQSRRSENTAYSVPRHGAMPVIASAGSVSLGPGTAASPYASIPAANYVTRTPSSVNSSSLNTPYDRQGGTYTVSYARR